MEGKDVEVTRDGVVKEFGENGISFYTNDFEFVEHLYNRNDNVIHHKDKNGEWWREYDGAGNEVHYKVSNGEKEEE